MVIFRTGLVLTKHGGLLKQLLLPFKLGVGGPIAGGEQFMSWIHLDDEVGLMLWALDDDQVSGRDQRDRAEPGDQPRVLQGARAGAAPPRRHARSRSSRSPRMRGSELADAVAGGARVLPRRALDLGYEFRHPELDEALRAALR